MTSSVLTPMEPVEPSTVTRRASTGSSVGELEVLARGGERVHGCAPNSGLKLQHEDQHGERRPRRTACCRCGRARRHGRGSGCRCPCAWKRRLTQDSKRSPACATTRKPAPNSAAAQRRCRRERRQRSPRRRRRRRCRRAFRPRSCSATAPAQASARRSDCRRSARRYRSPRRRGTGRRSSQAPFAAGSRATRPAQARERRDRARRRPARAACSPRSAASTATSDARLRRGSPRHTRHAAAASMRRERERRSASAATKHLRQQDCAPVDHAVPFARGQRSRPAPTNSAKYRVPPKSAATAMRREQHAEQGRVIQSRRNELRLAARDVPHVRRHGARVAHATASGSEPKRRSRWANWSSASRNFSGVKSGHSVSTNSSSA